MLLALSLFVAGLGAALKPGSAAAQTSETVTICFNGVSLDLPRVAVLDEGGSLLPAYAGATLGPCPERKAELKDDDSDRHDSDGDEKKSDFKSDDDDKKTKDFEKDRLSNENGGGIKVDIDGGPSVRVDTNNGPSVNVKIDDEPEVKVKTEDGSKIKVDTDKGPEVNVKTDDGPRVDVDTDKGPEVEVKANNAPSIEVDTGNDGPEVTVNSQEEWKHSDKKEFRSGEKKDEKKRDTHHESDFKDRCDREKVPIWEWDWKKCGDFCDFPDTATAQAFGHFCEKKDGHEGKECDDGSMVNFDGRCDVKKDFDPCKDRKSFDKHGVVFKDEKHLKDRKGFDHDKDGRCRIDVKHFDPCQDFMHGNEVLFSRDHDRKDFDGKDRKDFHDGRKDFDKKDFDKHDKDFCPKETHDPCKDFDKHEVGFDDKRAFHDRKDFEKKDFHDDKDKKDFDKHEVRFDDKKDFHDRKDFDKKDFKSRDGDRHKHDGRKDDGDCKVIVIIKKPVIVEHERKVIVEHKPVVIVEEKPVIVHKDDKPRAEIAPPRPPAAPITAVGVITPPSTGEAGLADEARNGGALSTIPVIILVLAGIAGVRRLQTR